MAQRPMSMPEVSCRCDIRMSSQVIHTAATVMISPLTTTAQRLEGRRSRGA